ncbi:MAG: AMP-binding protein [Prevotellaceae bacterium]|nr:AMP-binding protein [Prevotellaceae bacterium]
MDSNSFLANLEYSLKTNWDYPALSDFKAATLTYGDVARKIARIHLVFEACGLNKGDKVSIIGRNSAHWGVTFLATLSYGAVAVPILHEFKPDNVHHIVTHSESRILFAGNSSWESLDESQMTGLEAIILIDDFSILKSGRKEVFDIRQEIDELEKERFPKGFGPEDIKFHRDQREELALINYTSGTTGFSKGVMLPYRSLLSNMLFAEEALPDMKHGDSVVSMLPTAHMYGMAFEFLFEFLKGCQVHFLTRAPTPKIILEAFASIKPTLVISVPLIVEKIYKKQLLPAINKPFVRLAMKLPVVDKRILKRINEKLTNFFGGNFFEVIVGGAAFNPDAEKLFRRIGFKYTVGYGMTECAPIISYEIWDKIPMFSCGKAAPRMEIKIDSNDPENIPGEIVVRGDNVMLGYYKNKEATDECMKDGWLYTGDLGIIDRNGYLYIKGRSKNMLLGPSGQNIYPEEIESRYNNDNYVSESLIIDSGGKLIALVFPDFDAAYRDGLSNDDIEKKLEETRILINSELPHYSQISRVKIYPEEFEKTPKKSIKRFLYQV